MSSVAVKLQRSDPSQAWGFRIHGGVDFNQPLVILKVTAGSVSSQQGLEPGDQIIQINGQDSMRFRHKEAQQLILSGGNQVVFQVIRGNDANVLRAQFSNEAPITVQSLQQTKQSSTTTTSRNVIKSMVETSSTTTTAPAVVTPGWGGPKFSDEKIKELLLSQSQVLESGAIGVNFIKNDEKEDLDMQKSEVLKMLREIEKESNERARSPSVPPPTGGSSFGIYMNRHYESSVIAQQPQAPWANRQQLSPSMLHEPMLQPEPAPEFFEGS